MATGAPPSTTSPSTRTDYDERDGRGSSALGVAAVRNDVPGGPRQLFIEDPNGVRIEINVRHP